MKELVYTSERSGLRPGSTGFCTVAMTDGLPAAVVEFLERLSNTYRPVYMPYDARVADNPIAYSLIRVRIGGQSVTVLSRNAAAGVDHTGRSNNLAHHLVFDSIGHLVGSNPASLAAGPGTFLKQWDDEPRRLPSRRLPEAHGTTGICSQWQELTGDAGWAATVASAWSARDGRPLYLIYPTQTDVLGLLTESVSLLPAEQQWEASFTTYYTGLPPEATCAVRAVLAGTPQEVEARRGDHVDLMQLAGPAPEGPLADRARGRLVAAVQKTAAATTVGSPIDYHASFDRSTSRSLPLPDVIEDNELPPAVRPIKSPRPIQSPVARTLKSGAWIKLVALLFGAFAVLSVAVAVPFSKSQWEARVEAEQQRDDAEKRRDESLRLVEATINLRDEADRKATQNAVEAANARAASTKAGEKTADLTMEIERLTKRDIWTAIVAAAENQHTINEQKQTIESLQKSLAKANSAIKKSEKPSTFDDWYAQVETMHIEEKLIAYQRLDSDAEKTRRRTSVRAETFELVTHEISQKTKDGETSKRNVFRVKTGTPLILPRNRQLSVIGTYFSGVKSGDVPTYVPISGDRVVKNPMVMEFHVDPSFVEGIEKGGFHYLEIQEFPIADSKEKKLIFVINDSKQPTPGYLLWLKKKN